MSGDEQTFEASAMFDLVAERGIVGALLLDNSAFERVCDVLKAEDFFNPLTRDVYAEIQRQLLASKPADVVTVYSGLGGRHPLTDINELAQYVPSAANIARYASVVRERGMGRAMMSVGHQVTSLALDHERDINDRVEDAQAALAKLVADAPRDEWVSAEAGMMAHMAVLEERCDGKTSAMPTGLRGLDEYLEGGIRPGELVIVGARPSMGKTALAMTIGVNMATDYSVGMLSMEMPHTELRDRLTAMLGRVSLSSVKRPRRDHELDWSRVLDGIERSKTLNFYASDHGGLNINQVRSKARAMKRLHGLNILVVDYIGLMNGLDSRQQRAYQLEEVSRGLKTLAKELGIGVLCLAQVNRKVEERVDHTPNLSDLRDSGAIEQDADVVMFVHRPIQSRPDLGQEFQHYAKLSVAKNRNGRCGVMSLFYQGDQTRFDAWSGEAPTGRSSSAAGRREL